VREGWFHVARRGLSVNNVLHVGRAARPNSNRCYRPRDGLGNYSRPTVCDVRRNQTNSRRCFISRTLDQRPRTWNARNRPLEMLILILHGRGRVKAHAAVQVAMFIGWPQEKVLVHPKSGTRLPTRALTGVITPQTGVILRPHQEAKILDSLACRIFATKQCK
jgi:hypothetical protein